MPRAIGVWRMFGPKNEKVNPRIRSAGILHFPGRGMAGQAPPWQVPRRAQGGPKNHRGVGLPTLGHSRYLARRRGGAQ